MRLGTSSYAFTWAIGIPGYPVEQPMTATQLLEKSAALGVSCVQIADNMPLHQKSRQELSSIKKTADSLNISVEVGTRGLQPDNIKNYLEIAEQFESPILRVVIDSTEFEPTIQEIISILKELDSELAQRNIKLAIENHDRFLAAEFLHILENTNTKNIGICLDSVNSMGAGEGVHVVTEALGEYTINFHVKEFWVRRIDHKLGFIVEGKPAGQGMLPLEWMLEKISTKCQSAILEQWVPPQKTIQETIALENEWAQQSIFYLKKIFS